MTDEDITSGQVPVNNAQFFQIRLKAKLLFTMGC